MLRSFTNTRVLIDFDTFEQELGNGVLICTNQGVLNAIRMLIRSYGLREANWVTALSPAGYTGPDETQFDLIDSEISKFLGDTNDMAFCEDITTALENLSTSFQAGCCGDGTFGAGQDDPPASTQPDEEGDFPDEFDTYAEYRAYKCDIANRLVEGIKEDMDWTSGATLAKLTTKGLLDAFLTPVPFSELLALIGFLVALFLQGVLSATAISVRDTIVTERATLVCLLYDATTASLAKSNVSSYMAGLLTSTENALFAAVWWFASVNALFSKEIILESSPLPDAVSCDLCTSECELVIPTFDNPDDNGTFTIVSSGPTVIDAVSAEVVAHWAICDFNTDPVDPWPFCGPSVEVDTYPLSGFTPWSGEGYRLYDSALVKVYHSSTPPDWSLFTDIRRIQLKSSTPFTGTITLTT